MGRLHAVLPAWPTSSAKWECASKNARESPRLSPVTALTIPHLATASDPHVPTGRPKECSANGRFPHLAAFADTLWPNEALRMTRPVGSEIQKEMAQAGEFRSQPCDPDFNSRHASIHGEERGDETRQTRYPPRHKDLLDGALAIERQDDRPK